MSGPTSPTPSGAQPPSAAAPAPPGYRPPAEVDRRRALDREADLGLTSNRTARYRDQAVADTQTADAGYHLDPDAVRRLLPRWEELRDRLQDLRGRARELNACGPLAGDVISGRLFANAVRHARSYQDSLNQQYEYAKDYADKLRAAITGIEAGDGAAAEAVRQAAEPR